MYETLERIEHLNITEASHCKSSFTSLCKGVKSIQATVLSPRRTDSSVLRIQQVASAIDLDLVRSLPFALASFPRLECIDLTEKRWRLNQRNPPRLASLIHHLLEDLTGLFASGRLPNVKYVNHGVYTCTGDHKCLCGLLVAFSHPRICWVPRPEMDMGGESIDKYCQISTKH